MTKLCRGVQYLARIVVLSAGVVCTATAASTGQFGNMRFDAPANWRATQNGDVLFLSPPGLQSGQAVLLAISPSRTLTDLQVQFDAVVQKLQTERTVMKVGEPFSGQSPDGYRVLRRELVVREKNGATLYLLAMAANPNGRFESLYFAANGADLYRQHVPQVEQFTNSIKFMAQAAASPAKQATSPAPDSLTNNSAATPAYKDQKSRLNGEANLNPPPPGQARLDGLYATTETSGQIGTGGSLAFSTNWRFYYFLPNGYVYLGAKDAGLESLNCVKPTVNEYGDPMCTTYSADNDQLRIGKRNPVRLRRKGDDLQIGDYTFERVPKASNLRLSGSYEYFSTGVAAAISSAITFDRDGRFKSSNFTGVAIDTNNMLGSAQQPNRTVVSGSSEKSAEGTYRINGYTLELNYADGRTARAFFARTAGEEVVRIGGSVYTRKGK